MKEYVMRRLFVLLVVGLLMAGGAFAYDGELAKGYEQLFAPAAGKAAPKALHLMKTEDFVQAIKNTEDMVVLDVRTPKECEMIQLAVPNTLAIPMDQVFKPENLDRLPTDRKIVVVCKAGHRAMAVATGLRHIGFENTYVLKLGVNDLAKFVSPKTAY
jgi:rhodanese-related sulfurtransferase